MENSVTKYLASPGMAKDLLKGVCFQPPIIM
jgi:hypothetical protein